MIGFGLSSRIKKYLVFTGIVLNTSSCLAQDKPAGKPVYLGLAFLSAHSKIFYPNGTINQPGSNYISHSKAGPDASEKEFFPYKFGVDLKIRVVKRIAFSTGFFMDAMGTTYTQPASFVTDANGGFISFYPQLDFSSKYIYFEIPLRFDFRFTDKPFSPFLTFGGYSGVCYKAVFTDHRFSNGVVVKQSTTTTYFDLKHAPLSQTYSNFQLGFGLDARLKDFKLQAFPFYDFGFMVNTNVGGGSTYRHRIGGAVSITHRL